MNTTLVEHRKWFQVLVGLLAFATAWLCFFAVRAALDPSSFGAMCALLLLCSAAVAGFERLFTLLVPILLLKFFPRLEAPDASA